MISKLTLSLVWSHSCQTTKLHVSMNKLAWISALDQIRQRQPNADRVFTALPAQGKTP